MNLVINRKEGKRFIKFIIVGAFGAGIDFLVMNILTHIFYMELILAGSISFICAIISNFFWNRFWTYPDSRTRPMAGQLGMFFIVNLAGAAIRLPILYFLEPLLFKYLLKIRTGMPISTEFLVKNCTLAIAIFIVMLWNYYVNRYWTYNDIKS
jgi:putative flippase GtrA